MICISGSRLWQKNLLTTYLIGYDLEQTPTESSASGILLYISQKFSYEPHKHLQIYCPKELESANFIVGSMFKRPSLQNYKCNNDFPEDLLNKIQTKNKFSVLAGDFNLYLTKYSKTACTNQFFGMILSHNFCNKQHFLVE